MPRSLLPAWTFGLWLSTSFLTSYDEKTVSGFLQGMQERACPVRVFHLDCFWMKQYEWCSFTFDPEHFPDPKAYLAEIKRKGCVVIRNVVPDEEALKWKADLRKIIEDNPTLEGTLK